MKMSKNMSIEMNHIAQIPDSKWDDAIRDAESEIQRLNLQAKRLQQAIRIFRLNKREGVEWPENIQESRKKPGISVRFILIFVET
jgi:hypothetical protein